VICDTVRVLATAPSKPPAATLAPTASARVALVQTARECLAYADAHLPGVKVDGSPESLHQFRVAFRRLRSLLSLYREVVRKDPVAMDLKLRLRALTTLLGPARDLDVFLADHPTLEPSDRARVEQHRRAAYVVVATYLSSPQWPRLLEDINAWLGDSRTVRRLSTQPGTARPFTAAAMDRRLRRIIDGGADLASLQAEQRHRVRIEAKKLRYGAQFFGSMWPAEPELTATLEKRLGKLQDTLGALNDAATAEQLRVDCELDLPPVPHPDGAGLLRRAQSLVNGLGRSRRFWERPPLRVRTGRVVRALGVAVAATAGTAWSGVVRLVRVAARRIVGALHPA
jgi:triphosphatase